jgi:hypothetical protein
MSQLGGYYPGKIYASCSGTFSVLRDEKHLQEYKKVNPVRTNQQNRALHLYYKLIANQLNDTGYQHHTGIGIDVRFTETIIKEEYWRPIQFEMFKIKSTKDINTNQINDIIDAFSLYFGERGVYVEFPNWQSFMNKLDAKTY